MIMPETTPTFICEVGTEYVTGLSNCRIDIQQGDLLIQKYYKEPGVIIDEEKGTICVTLTQEQTHGLDSKKKLEVQVHGLLNDGTAWKTLIYSYKVGETISDEILLPSND